ncbi:MAG: hypothetical protein ACHP84_08175 [Caulobacterales bacterium]
MIGDTKVHLRANKSQEGKSTQSTTIVLSLLVSPLFLLMHGKDATIPKGQAVVGYVDSDVDIAATPRFYTAWTQSGPSARWRARARACGQPPQGAEKSSGP